MCEVKLNNRIIALLLVVTMMIPMCAEMLPLDVFAAVGELSNVSTGLTGEIDTSDTISLPIKILDYEADGMLFEYAEAYADAEGRGVGNSKTASDFGATWAVDFASLTAIGSVTASMYGDFWGYTTETLNTTNSYASYMRATWAANSTQAPHTVYGRSGTIMPNDLNLSMDNARYLVLVYRSNVTSGKIGFFVERANADRNNTNNRVGDLTFTSEGATNWTYAVYDLKQGNLANSWNSYGNATAIWTTLPMDASGEYIDLAHVALFADPDLANKFGEYALTDGSDRGDNRGFGLLRTSRTQSGGTNFEGVLDQTTTVEELNTYGDITSADFSTLSTLGYTLLGTFRDAGIANVGLLESSLSDEGYPVYKEEVVTYVAKLLKHSLEIPERTSDGWKNYRYVKGTASSVYGGTDLASALRTKINGNMGSYAAAAGKDLVGTWSEVNGNILSYYDAAYFLLNSIFVPGSYNVEQDDYDYLVLSAGTDAETNDKIYVFDAGFTTSATPESANMAIKYNGDTDTIQNTSAAGKTHFVYEGNSTTTLNPFLPVTDKNNMTGQTQSPYYQDDGIINTLKKVDTKDTYYERNFNFALVSGGEFVYHADDELFFDFEGDDDVYLFINGELVMDIGSAHSIDGVRFELNDYVNAAKAGTLGSAARNNALALTEGDTYEFKFYYMERHGYGSNMRIETNIRVTDPTMAVRKTAYQSDVQIDYGSIIDKLKPVEYGFAMTNTGERPLFNLIFSDSNIGIKFDGTQDDAIPVMAVTGTRVSAPDGGTLDISDLVVMLNGEVIEIATEKDLRNFLCHSIDGNGFQQNDTVLIRGFAYTLSAEQVDTGVFDNTVLVQSNTNPDIHFEFTYLHGQASMRVFVPADPMYYQWAGHELKVTKEKLVTDVLAAANQTGNILEDMVPGLSASNVNKLEFVTKAGNPISYDWVKLDSDGTTLIINSSKPGSQIFYVKITYDSSKTAVIPVLVNITAVEDNYIVLDYGLPVDIQAATLKVNDTVAVPGRTTKDSMLGITTDDPSYAPNEITFSVAESNTIEGTYGVFTMDAANNVLAYRPTRFMEGEDTIYLAVNVYEEDTTPSKIDGTLNINREVEMFQKVTIVPANVVYYEDNFEAINFFDETTMKNTITVIGSAEGYKQSDNQGEQYGHDAAYAASSNATQSGGTITKIAISDATTPLTAGELLNFDFNGTGFELIARTNAYDTGSLVLEVEVTPYTSTWGVTPDTTNTQTRRIPIITEFDNGGDGGEEEVYQISIARLENLPCAKWHVSVKSIIAYDYSKPKNEDGTRPQRTTYLYLDGIRIFNPFDLDWDDNGIEDGDQYYMPTEQNAAFIELRKKIVNGGIAVVQTSDTGEIVISTSTTTWTENRNGTQGTTIDANEVNSVNDYLIKGPNNEVYMYGEDSDAALVFYVEDSNDALTSSLQIAARAIDYGSFLGTGELPLEAKLQYGVKTDTGYAWTPLVTLVSATEQYYEIDYTKCPYVDGKGYQVAIKVESGMTAFTSLKLVGLSLAEENVGTAATLTYINGILYELSAAPAAQARTSSGWTVARAAAYPAFNVISEQMSTDTVVSISDDATYTIPDCDHKIIVTPSKPSDPSDPTPTPDDNTSITGTLPQLLARAEKTLVDDNGINWGYYEDLGWRAICMNNTGLFQLCTAGDYMILTNRALPTTGYGMSGHIRVKYYFAMGEWQAVGDGSVLSAAAMMQVLLAKNPLRMRNCEDPTVVEAVYDEKGIMWIKRDNGNWASTRQTEYSGDYIARYIDSLERVWIMDKSARTWVLETPPETPENTEQKPEAEIPAEQPIDNAMQYVLDQGLFAGIDEKLIEADAPMTRSLFVAALGRMVGVDVMQFIGTTYTDVSADQLYAPYVEWAAKSGIVTGVTATEFAPEAELTVEQAVVFLARYAEYVGKGTASKQTLDAYADVSAVSSWALDAMRWAVENGIYTGIGGKLAPQTKASCSLVVQMLYAFSMNVSK